MQKKKRIERAPPSVAPPSPDSSCGRPTEREWIDLFNEPKPVEHDTDGYVQPERSAIWASLEVAGDAFVNRFTTRENFIRLAEIRDELHVCPADVLDLCVNSHPVPVEAARSLKKIERDVAGLRAARDLVAKVLIYFRVPAPDPHADPEAFGRDTLDRSLDQNPIAWVIRTFSGFPPRAGERIGESLSGLIDELAARLEKAKSFLAREDVRTPNLAKKRFFREWEWGTRQRQDLICASLARRQLALRNKIAEEETRIGTGQPGERWNILAARLVCLTQKAQRLNRLFAQRDRTRMIHGMGLFDVIFGHVIQQDAYEKAAGPTP